MLAGEPIADAARAAGASDLLKMNAIYPFSNGGAFMTNFLWCAIADRPQPDRRSQFLHLPRQGAGTLGFYYLMALRERRVLVFPVLLLRHGPHYMGTRYGFTSWALHMAMLILFSNVYGWLFQEWEGVGMLPLRAACRHGRDRRGNVDYHLWQLPGRIVRITIREGIHERGPS